MDILSRLVACRKSSFDIRFGYSPCTISPDVPKCHGVVGASRRNEGATVKRTILLAVTAALGLAAAIGYTAKPALAWDIANLPAGYTTQHITATTETCQDSYYIFGY